MDRAYRDHMFPNPDLVPFYIFNSFQVDHIRFMNPHKLILGQIGQEVLDCIMYHQVLPFGTYPDIVTLAFD